MKVLGIYEPAEQPTAGGAQHRRWSLRGLAVVAISATAALGIVAPASTAVAAGPRPHVARLGTHYFVAKHLCAAAKANHASCMSIRRSPADKLTPHATAYTVDTGFPVGPSGGLTPGDLAAAYGYDRTSANGAGLTQKVAIVDAYNDPNIVGDLAAFDANYGLPAETATSFQVVGQTGSPTALPRNDTTGWSGEEALDVDTVRGVCNTCTIVLVEANSSSNADLGKSVDTAVKMGATEISNSYGGAEGPKKKFSKNRKTRKKQQKRLKAERKAEEKPYTHKGVVITASTGDDGFFSWDKANEGRPSAASPNVPSSLPQVVAVGGTKLSLNSNATRRSESVWNANGKADATALEIGLGGLGATGGGCSNNFRANTWQHHVAGYSKTGCGAMRLAADVSADADPASGYDVYDTYNCGKRCGGSKFVPGWTTIGGTSLSSPLIAAMWALAGGSHSVAYPAQTLYKQSTAVVSSFYDVTTGGNSWCDGASFAACKRGTETASGHSEANPNSLALIIKKHVVRLGQLDCGFPLPTAKGKDPKHMKAVKANRQCYAGKGYDGPTGLGTPNGLTGFEAAVAVSNKH